MRPFLKIALSLWLCFIASCSEPHLIVNQEGEVTPPLIQLLGLTGIRIEDDAFSPPPPPPPYWSPAKLWIKSRSLKEVTQAVQGKIDPQVAWRAHPHLERWQIKSALSLSQAQAIKTLCFKDIHQENSIFPATKTYKGVLFAGTILARARLRLAFLNTLVETKACAFEKVYLLTGERTLDASAGETKAALLDSTNKIIPFRSDWIPSPLPKGEPSMIYFVFEQSRHKDLKLETILLVNAPKKAGQKRATTEDTVIKWLEEFNPAPGKYLLISNQPYILYQQLVVEEVLLKHNRRDIQIEAVGPGISDDEKLCLPATCPKEASVLLDNLSKILYELVIIRTLQENS